MPDQDESRHTVSMGAADLRICDLGGGQFRCGIDGGRDRTILATAADMAHLAWLASREFFRCPTAAEWWLMNTLGELETEVRARDPERAAA